MEVADRRLHTTKKGGLNRRRVKEVVVKIWGSLDGLGFLSFVREFLEKFERGDKKVVHTKV